MTKQQLLDLLRAAYMTGWGHSLIDEDKSDLFISQVEHTNRVGDLELPYLMCIDVSANSLDMLDAIDKGIEDIGKARQLGRVIYCVDSWYQEMQKGNHFDANEWLRHIRNAYDNYFNYEPQPPEGV